MIPVCNQSGVLPPFLPGVSPIEPGAMAPYRVSLLDVAHRYATSDERLKILKGFLTYREELRLLGFDQGFQWIDGSFVENIEANSGRPPRDIDLITFAHRPFQYTDNDVWRAFLETRSDLFNPELSKGRYFCDAYFVDMTSHPRYLINQTKYWFGLFSHQRETYLWKGMLEIPLCDDTEVAAFLSGGGSNAA
ncbi:MAG: hypothetical protein HW415_2056 [Deltaproteobacteria bacterium]|nr:hypothetical protein [Deltaproteobacteria bacterium]